MSTATVERFTRDVAGQWWERIEREDGTIARLKCAPHFVVWSRFVQEHKRLPSPAEYRAIVAESRRLA